LKKTKRAQNVPPRVPVGASRGWLRAPRGGAPTAAGAVPAIQLLGVGGGRVGGGGAARAVAARHPPQGPHATRRPHGHRLRHRGRLRPRHA